MIKYQLIAKSLMEKFDQIFIELVPRLENTQADALARLATSEGAADMSNISITDLTSPTGSQHTMNVGEVTWLEQMQPTSLNFDVCQVTSEQDTWMTPIIQYIKTGVESEDKVLARRLHLRAARYTLIDEQLYKRGFSLPLLKCVTPEEGLHILQEIHDGIYGNHTGGQSLVYKSIRQGYFWLSLRKDPIAYTRACHKY